MRLRDEHSTNAGRLEPMDLSNWHACSDGSCREGYDGDRYYGPDTRPVRVRVGGRFASARYCPGCAPMVAMR